MRSFRTADLPPAPSPEARPQFALYALRDAGAPGHPGNLLQRLQVVKLQIQNGEIYQSVFDVAGEATNGASVDLATCRPRGTGFGQLCAVWQDPDFRADERALYYARVVENPSCRWQQYYCVAAGVDCADPASIPQGLAACCDPEIPRSIQERAWSSPIWHAPPASAVAGAQ